MTIMLLKNIIVNIKLYTFINIKLLCLRTHEKSERRYLKN